MFIWLIYSPTLLLLSPPDEAALILKRDRTLNAENEDEDEDVEGR